MLPALKIGLAGDDLPQRAVELKPSGLPAQMTATGNPADSGSLTTVLRELFYYRTATERALARSYGMFPWWAPADMRIGLWRPVTAFSHWLDYQFFPDSPALMHAENIAWFAGIIFLVTVLYRRLMGISWAAGLAALLFLLDGNTFFPVAFVANRGFMMALFFGLMCFYEHVQWRSQRSRTAMGLSAVFLALSVLSDEAGASTLAFIIAYAVVMEAGTLRQRVWTVLPAAIVIAAWHTVYTLLGFGIFHMGGYLDPINEPWEFARQVLPRAMLLLGGQLTQIAPEIIGAVKPSLWSLVGWVCCAVVIGVSLVWLPWLRRNKIARFWLVIMAMAALAAATVVPLGKNLGFTAFGAYGLMAGFAAALMSRPVPLPATLAYRIAAWAVMILLLMVHVPGAIAGRVLMARGMGPLFGMLNYFGDIDHSPDAEGKDVVVINAPSEMFLAYAPFYKAYCQQPLPASMRMLAPGCTGLTIQRLDEHTLVIQSQGPDLFSCDDVGPIHAFYFFRMSNLALTEARFKKGDRYTPGGLSAEILELDADNLPSRVAFHFDAPLDSPNFHWLEFDWATKSYRPFVVPPVGQSYTLPGPGKS